MIKFEQEGPKCTWTRIPDNAPVYAGQYETTCEGIEHLYDRDWGYCPLCGNELIINEERAVK